MHEVGLGWRNPPGRITDRPQGVRAWQFNLFHHAMRLRLPGGERRIEAPVAMIFAPGQAQWYHGADGGFSDDWLSCSGPFQRLLHVHAVPVRTPFRLANPSEVEGCLRAMRRELSERQPFADEALSDWLRQLVRLLARGLAADAGRDPRQLAVQRLRAQLRERCAEPWTVARMAAATGLGAHRFAVLYRRWTGSSPLHDLIWFRMRRAQAALEAGGSVAQAAAACGYRDQLYFSRHFRRWAGTPPSAWNTQARRLQRATPR